MTPLSWQPPPVTKCGECKYVFDESCDFNCGLDGDALYNQNADGITQSCPAWQQQNKDKQ